MIPDQPQHPDSNDTTEPNRLDELLADRALGMLSAEDAAELDQLLRQSGEQDADAFDRIAAALQIGALSGVLEPLPESVERKIRARAVTVLSQAGGSNRVASSRPKPDRASPMARWAILLAPIGAVAAVVAVAVGVWLRTASQPSLEAQRQQLIATAPDVVTLPWTRTNDPAGALAVGDVVWSQSRQAGFMRFRGLGANDPHKAQYQVWIIDADRDERYPVDGGVFDIPPKPGESIIPITAKLQVSHPKLFAVTIEQPGGVVVSERKHLPLLAKTSD